MNSPIIKSDIKETCRNVNIVTLLTEFFSALENKVIFYKNVIYANPQSAYFCYFGQYINNFKFLNFNF